MSKRLEDLLQYYDEDEPDSFILFALAQEYEQIDQPDAALIHYEKLLDLHPDYVGGYYHYAGLLAKTNQSEKALEIYDAGMAVATELKDQHSLAELQNAKLNMELGLI